MTTYIVYADTTDGYLKSTGTMAQAYAGSGSVSPLGGTFGQVGVQVNSNGSYEAYEWFLSFDTSVIPDSDEIVDAQMVLTMQANTSQVTRYSIEAYPFDWGTTLTSADWRTPGNLRNFADRTIQMLINKGNNPAHTLYSGSDGFAAGISKTGPSRYVFATNNLTDGNPLGQGYHSTRLNGAETGSASNRPRIIIKTMALTALTSVVFAQTQLANNVTCSIRSSGAASPSLTLGYQVPGGAWTSIGAVPTGATTGKIQVMDNENSVSLVSDPAGNLYVIGKDGTNDSAIRVQVYNRTGTTNAWTLGKSMAQGLPGSTGSLNGFDACYIDGTKDAIFVIGSRVQGWYSDYSSSNGATVVATIDPVVAKRGSGTLFIQSQSDPTWADPYNPQIPSIFAQPVCGQITVDNTNIGVLVNGRVRVLSVKAGVIKNIGIESIGRDPKWGQTGAPQVLRVSNTSFAVASPEILSGINYLRLGFYNLKGAQLGQTLIPGSVTNTGTFSNNWDAWFERVGGNIRVYYPSAANGANIVYVDVSPTTYKYGAETAAGALTGVQTVLRTVHQAGVDERRVLIEGSTAAKASSSVFDATGDRVPNAPALNPITNFDSTSAKKFTWAFSDPNSTDKQTKFQLSIERVSDSTVVFDTGTVTAVTSAYSLPANSIANSVDYRWRVRTYDTYGNLGSWSGYSLFSTVPSGTVTITDPSADYPVLDVAYYNVVWSYTQSAGQTQTQYRVVVTNTVDSSILVDTGNVTSTANNYTITGLVSDQTYQIAVTVINTGGTSSPAALRFIQPSFSAPMVPFATQYPEFSDILITVENPDPSGDRPEVNINEVWRREPTIYFQDDGTPFALDEDTTPFTRVGFAGYNGTYQDFAVASGHWYQYFVQGMATTGAAQASDFLLAQAPVLEGVHVFDPTDPAGTARQYLYGFIGRQETIGVDSTPIQYVGRAYPVYETGSAETMTVGLTATIPYSVTTEDDIQWFRDAERNRRAICYRDNRGRKLYVFLGDITITDTVSGATVATTGRVVDFSESV